jgi:transposase
MRMIGCDFHAAQQTIAMLDRETGEIVERKLTHDGTTVRDFYAGLPPPVVVGMEATGSRGGFLRLMEELGITCQVGDPAKIRQGETRRQSTIGETRDSCWTCCRAIAFRRSGCRRWNSGICARCYGTAISGYGCGPE